MKSIWTGRIISGLVLIPFVFGSVMKLAGSPEVIESMAQMQLPESLRVPVGILELTCALVYAIPALSVLGAVLLTGFVGGTILTHLRLGQPVYIQMLLGLLVWLGLYLREARLHVLLPIRKSAHRT